MNSKLYIMILLGFLKLIYFSHETSPSDSLFCKKSLQNHQQLEGFTCQIEHLEYELKRLALKTNISAHTQHPKHCIDLLKHEDKHQSDVYLIQPVSSHRPFLVFCDMETTGGGWVQIMKRYDGSQEFFLGWKDYKEGFGNFVREYWLGLENIHFITGYDVTHELLIELIDWDDKKRYAFYDSFSISNECNGFALTKLGQHEGDAGNALRYHLHMKFSTKDKDQDKGLGNCATEYHGAWWYNACMHSQLTGKYVYDGYVSENETARGIIWGGFRDSGYSLKAVRMLVRPRVN